MEREIDLLQQQLLGLGGHAYRELVQSLPVALYVCDADGRIQLYNDEAVRLWGRTPTVGKDEWSGSHRMFRPDGSPMPLDQCPMAVAMKEGRSVRDVEIIIERPDGSRRNVLPFPTPIHDAGGRIIGAVNMLVDLTDRRAELSERRAGEIAQARLGAIVESSFDAIVSKSLQGIVATWNGSAERMFGYKAEEVVGKSILMIIPPDRRDEEAEILRRLQRGERIDHLETERLCKDGHRIHVSLTISPVRDSHGTIIGASKIARDISEQKRLEQEMERLLEAERHAREEAQRVSRMKDEFLATLSHELRTPLNAIMGWAQLLVTSTMTPEEMREAGEIIERNARTQKQLVDDLLDMSRIISGKLRLDVQRVEPTSFIEAAIDTVRPSAVAKDICIEQMLDPIAGQIVGDPARLQQVVWNLLINAIKFTPKGGRVQVLLQRVNSHIELTISDTGQGISPEFLPQLFSRFSQADAKANRRHGGLGLGLAIVKQLIELHGGTIRAHSEGEGKGATFVIQLPLPVFKPGDADRVHPASAFTGVGRDTARADLTQLKVLLIDDEPDARELVRRLLTESGAQVTTAESATQALGLLEQEQRPDILLSDIGMPGVDGYEFLRKVRKLAGGACARIPAVALTAFARSEDRTRALRAGYIAHITKPVEPSELLATVAVVAGRVDEHWS
jgi:PAS domain S-box-containing protein